MGTPLKAFSFCIASVAALAVLLLALGLGYERFAEYRDWQRHPPPGKLVEVDGRKLHLYCQGTGKPTVIVATGAGAPSFRWWTIQEAVAKTTRVCTYDRAGFGWSESAPAGRSIHDRAVELARLLKNGQIDAPYIVVAHSYGALIAEEFIHDRRDEIVGLVLVDAADKDFVYTPSFLEAAVAESASLRNTARLGSLGIRRAQLSRMTSPQMARSLGVSESLLERIGLTAAGLSYRYSAEYADEMGSFAYTPLKLRQSAPAKSLSGLPIVVLKHGVPFTGSMSALEHQWDEAQNRLARLSEHSELIVAGKSGHEIYRDEPQLVIEAIRRVMSK